MDHVTCRKSGKSREPFFYLADRTKTCDIFYAFIVVFYPTRYGLQCSLPGNDKPGPELTHMLVHGGQP